MKIGPFRDFEKNPIIKPGCGFYSKGAYNPAVIKEKGKFFMLFRAESSQDKLTGRIGLAKGEDGFNFDIHPEPVILPDRDFDRFGCEDPRIIKVGDTFYLTYVGNSGKYGVGNICLATSTDLFKWKKYGSILKPTGNWDKGQVKAGAILPCKIKGKFIMYFMGENKPWETAIGIAISEDLIHWQELQDRPVLSPRKGYFDSKGVEPGPPPVLTDDGIVLIYAGWGEDNVYKIGAAIFSRSDPCRVIAREDEPILYPSKDWGRYFGTSQNHAVPQGLVIEGNLWLLYYGAADKASCVALWEVGK